MAGLSYLLLCSWRMWLWLLIWLMGGSFTTGLWLHALGMSELLKMTHHIRYASILMNLLETISQETYHRRESGVAHQVTLHTNHIQPHSAPRRSKIPALQWTHALKSLGFLEMTTGVWRKCKYHPPTMADYDSDYIIKLYQNGSDIKIHEIQSRITPYHYRWISYGLIISYLMSFSFLLSYRLPTYRPTHRPTYWPTYLTCHLSICCLFVPMVHAHCISSSAPVAWLNVHSKKQT